MALRDVCRTEVVTVHRESSVREAALLMREHHVGDLIVMNDHSSFAKPVGIVTDRDIVCFVVSHGASGENTKVEDIMTHPLKTAYEDQGIYETVKIMRENSIRRLPVVGHDGRLLGIVTVDDLLGLLATELQNLAAISTRQMRKEAENMLVGVGGSRIPMLM